MNRRSEAARRGWQRHRERAQLQPSQIARWRRDGVVSASMTPILDAAVDLYAAMVQDLGGVDQVSAMQRAALDGWLAARIAVDAELQLLLQDGDTSRREKLATFLNSARAHLAALGLERRARDVTDLDHYEAALDARDRIETTTQTPGDSLPPEERGSADSGDAERGRPPTDPNE